ncbi:unnamed protein product, partial [Closterium sp. NIES-54]
VLLVALLAHPSLRGVPPPPLPPPTPLLLLLTSLVLRMSELLPLVGSAAAARERVAGVVEVAAGVVVGAKVEVVEAVEVVAVVGVVAGVGASAAAVVAAVGVAVVAAVGVVVVGLELLSEEVLAVATGTSSSVGARPRRPSSFVGGFLSVGRLGVVGAARMLFARRPRWEELLRSQVAIFDLEFDAILGAMYELSVSAEGDCYLCVPPDLGIEAAALGASESALPGTAPAEALHTFTLDTGASRCFFRDSTTLTPLSAPVPVRPADPSGGLVVARSSTVLSCPAVPSGSLSGLHLPLFSTNLVSIAALQDAMVTTTTPGGQRVSICTCTWTSRHLATFTRRPGSSLYTLATEPPQVAASAQVSTSDQVAPPCSCRLLSHKTLLRHHQLGHPSLPRLRGTHSYLLVSGLPKSLPPLLPLPATPCLPCIKGRQCSAPHSSSFPPTSAPLQTLHMDVWGPACVSGQGRERYFLLVVDDYTRYTTVFPLRSKGEGILQSFTLPASPQQNGIAECRIGLVMEVARTSMIHAAAPHFQWPSAVRYAAHQLNLWPRVSLPETSPTLRWTGKVGDASVLRVWESRAFVRDTSADKLSACAIPCGPAPSGVSQVDPLPGTVPVEVAIGSSATRGAASRGAASGGAEPGGVEPGGAEPGGAEPGVAEPAGVESGGAEPAGSEPRGAESGGAEPRGTASSGVTAEAGGTRGATAASPGGAAAASPGGACTSSTRAAGTGSVGGAGAGDPMKPGGAKAGGTGAGGVGAVGAGARGTGDVDPGAGGAGGTVRPRPYFVPLLQQVLGVPSSTGLTPPLLCPPPD